MNPIEYNTPPTSPPDVTADAAPAARSLTSRGLWSRVFLVFGLIILSGILRAEQMRRVEKILEEGRHSPFPLKEIPLELGNWKGESAELDPRIAAGTGSVDYIFRHYVNQLTGTGIDVIVLYGPSTDMFIHSPERCYPAAGYGLAAGPESQMIPSGEGVEVPFRSLVYTKGLEGRSERQEVYFSWRYRNRWSPDVGSHKEFERIPGMYKVHLARSVTGQERRDVDNPCRQLLLELLPEIEKRSAEARKQAAGENPPSDTADRAGAKETTATEPEPVQGSSKPAS